MAWYLVKPRDYEAVRIHWNVHSSYSEGVLHMEFQAPVIATARDSSVGIALGYGLDDRGSVLGIFL
jgi:hypothetical protein